MSVYTEELKAACVALEKAEEAAEVAARRYLNVKGHCGQSGYSISINGTTVAVSQCDRRTYQGTLIRGREMMHLGALKALDFEKDQAEAYVKKCREHILKIVDWQKSNVVGGRK